MTDTVKRYSYGYHADGFGEGRTLGLIEKEDGNLVRYEDYELLREQRDSFQRVSIRAMEERDRDAAARDQYRALSIKYYNKLSEVLKELDELRSKRAACPACNGTGSDDGRQHPNGEYEAYRCSTCDGFGSVALALPPLAGKVAVPDVLFDGHAVYTESCRLRALKGGNARTSPENVSDTLDAVVSLLRGQQANGEL